MSLPALNQDLERMARAPKTSGADLRNTLLRRRAMLSDALRRDPAGVSRWLLSDKTRELLRSSAPGVEDLVESAGEWSGQLEVRIEDDWENGRANRKLFLMDGGTPVELLHTADGELGARCGDQVSIRGYKMAGEWVAGEVTERKASAAAVGCSLTGEQKVAVILVNFPSTPLPAAVTPAAVQAAFFGSGRSLDTYWREVSGDTAWATGGVFGPFNLTTNYSCNQADSIRAAAIQAADSSIDFRQYNRLFIIVPNTGSCAIGLGTIGCNGLSSADGFFTASTTWLRADYLVSNDAILSVAAHEGGHNLGLDHASSLDYGAETLGPSGAAGIHSEYENRYSIMGISWRINSTYGLGHYSANHKANLGWLTPGNGFQQVTSSGNFTILPAEMGSGTRALRVERGSGSNKWLWLEYRRPLGLFDTTLSTYSSTAYSGTLIHYEDPTSAYSRYARVLDFHPSNTPNNFNDAVLRAGESWNDPYSPLRIVIDSASSTSASVRVEYGAPCAVLNPPSQTVPASAGAASVTVTAGAGCAWTVSSTASSWLQVTGGASGSGNGVVSLSIAANPGPTMREGTLTIQQQNVTIRQEAAVPPGTPFLQSPANSATGVALSPSLGWSAASSATSYDLHLGTYSPPPLFASGIGATSMTVGPLAPATTYYWQVVSRNAYGTANSSIYSFTTASLAYPVDKIGIYQGGNWAMDLNGNGAFDGNPADRFVVFGAGPYQHVLGDWGARGFSSMGIYSNGFWFLDKNQNGVWDGIVTDQFANLGSAGWTPVVGDWNGDGRSKIGIFKDGLWHLDYNGDFQFTGADRTYSFGGPGSLPVVGDWNGDGVDDIGVYANGLWFLDMNNNGTFEVGAPDRSVGFGNSSFIPVLGDWNGDGKIDIGIYNPTTGEWYVDYNGNFQWDGPVTDRGLVWGGSGSTAVVGDWNGDGRDKIGVFSSGVWTLDYNGDFQLTGADKVYYFGASGQTPVVGKW